MATKYKIWLLVMIAILSYAIFQLIRKYWPRKVTPTNATAADFFRADPTPVVPVATTTTVVMNEKKEEYISSDMEVAVGGDPQKILNRPALATIAKIQVIEGDVRHDFGTPDKNSMLMNLGDQMTLGSAKEIDIFQFQSIGSDLAASQNEAKIKIHFYKLV